MNVVPPSTQAPPVDTPLLVVGLVRNGQRKVAADVARMQSALKAFKQVRWLLIESDSADGSVNELQSLCKTVPGFQFISLGSLQQKHPLRTDRIAHCRNVYLEQLDARLEYANVELVVMADFDGINTLLDEKGILSCWERLDWHVCAANQAGPYYDIWALRHELWSPNDCRVSHQFLVQHGMSHEKALFASVLSRMITVPAGNPWVEVDSAFGGMAIYRRDVLRGLRYSGLTVEGKEICEHVGLHAAIQKQGGKIFVNPRLIAGSGTGHAEPLRVVNKLARLARQYAKALLVGLGLALPGKRGLLGEKKS